MMPIEAVLQICIYRFRHFPVDFPVCHGTRYNLRDRLHNRQLPLPSTVRLSGLPIFTAFRIWNCLDSIAINLDLQNFSFYVKNNARLYIRIYMKLCSSGREIYLFSIDNP